MRAQRSCETSSYVHRAWPLSIRRRQKPRPPWFQPPAQALPWMSLPHQRKLGSFADDQVGAWVSLPQGPRKPIEPAALAVLAGTGVEADSAASETTGVLRGRPGPRFGLASAGASAASAFTFRGRPGPRFTGEAEVVLSAVFFGASEASAALVSATSLSLIIYACCTFSQSLRKESRPPIDQRVLHHLLQNSEGNGRDVGAHESSLRNMIRRANRSGDDLQPARH